MTRPWLDGNNNQFGVRKLAHVARLKARIGWQNLRTEEFVDDGPYCVTGTDFLNGQVNWQTSYHVSPERYEIDRNIQLRAQDLLITKDGTIGKVAIVQNMPGPATLNSGVFLLRSAGEGVHSPFMKWVVQSKVFDDFVAYNSTGSTINHLYQNVFEQFRFPYPDRETQNNIADFLDRETARIDELIEKKRRLLEAIDRKWAATITFSLANGLAPEVARKPSGISWLNDVPAHWTVAKLGRIGRCTNGINISGDAFGSGFPFVSYSDVYRNPELPTNVEGLVQSSLNDRARYDLKEGDVLFTRTSETIDEIGFSSVCMKDMPDAVFAGFLIRFRPIRGVLVPRFSKFLFRNEALRAYFAKEMMIVTRASLSQGLLQKMPVALPPLEEQEQISHYLSAKEKKYNSVSGKTATSIDRLREFRAALITAAVTGQIDVATWGKRSQTDHRLDQIEAEMSVREARA